MFPNLSVLRWSPPNTVVPFDASASPTRALLADVTVPIAAGVAPFRDIPNIEYDTNTATTARRRNIFPSRRAPRRILTVLGGRQSLITSATYSIFDTFDCWSPSAVAVTMHPENG